MNKTEVNRFNCCPDQLTLEQLETYFGELTDTHSWSTVKIDRNGLQFFWRHVLQRDWEWFKIVKPPKIKTLPDILTPTEIEQLIGKTRKLRYRVFLLTTYSMGLRLEEALSLQVGDIDAGMKRAQSGIEYNESEPYLTLTELTPKLGYRHYTSLWRLGIKAAADDFGGRPRYKVSKAVAFLQSPEGAVIREELRRKRRKKAKVSVL